MAAGEKPHHLLAIAGAVAIEKVHCQQRNVFAPVAKRRQMNLDRVEPEEQVLAEVAGLGLLVQLGVGGGENAHIDAPGLRGSHALQLAGFKNAQELGLLAHGDVGNLVEKQRAPVVGQLEASECDRCARR